MLGADVAVELERLAVPKAAPYASDLAALVQQPRVLLESIIAPPAEQLARSSPTALDRSVGGDDELVDRRRVVRSPAGRRASQAGTSSSSVSGRPADPAARASAAGSARSPRRLIQTLGGRARSPARCRGSGSARRGRAARARRRSPRRTASQCACAGLYEPISEATIASRTERRSAPSTPRSGRGRCSRGSRASSRVPRLLERRRHLRERRPVGSDRASASLHRRRRAEPAQRLASCTSR